jgi:hypothetical protein
MRAFMRLYNVIEALRRNPARYFIEGGMRPWRVIAYRAVGTPK